MSLYGFKPLFMFPNYGRLVFPAPGGLFYICKKYPNAYIHERLSTIIDMVLSMHVYYNIAHRNSIVILEECYSIVLLLLRTGSCGNEKAAIRPPM